MTSIVMQFVLMQLFCFHNAVYVFHWHWNERADLFKTISKGRCELLKCPGCRHSGWETLCVHVYPCFVIAPIQVMEDRSTVVPCNQMTIVQLHPAELFVTQSSRELTVASYGLLPSATTFTQEIYEIKTQPNEGRLTETFDVGIYSTC